MVKFLESYWLIIYAVVVILLDILILIIKRRPKTLDDFTLILNESFSSYLPALISKFEEPGNGVMKKLHVTDCMRSIIVHKLGRKFSSKEEKIFEKFISESIESILSTPQKKA